MNIFLKFREIFNNKQLLLILKLFPTYWNAFDSDIQEKLWLLWDRKSYILPFPLYQPLWGKGLHKHHILYLHSYCLSAYKSLGLKSVLISFSSFVKGHRNRTGPRPSHLLMHTLPRPLMARENWEMASSVLYLPNIRSNLASKSLSYFKVAMVITSGAFKSALQFQVNVIDCCIS